jgi:hypothetical protein
METYAMSEKGLPFLYPRLFGYLVLLFALASADSLLGLVELASGAALGSVWLNLLENCILLAYFVGAVALLSGKAWGRWVVVGASCVTLLRTLTYALPDAQMYESFSPWLLWLRPGTALLIAAAMLVGVFRLEAAPVVNEQVKRDLAYGSFMFLGVVSLWSAYALSPGPSGDDGSGAAGVFGFLVFLPFALPAAVALLVGGSLSLLSWPERRPLSLLALTIVFSLYMGGSFDLHWLPWLIYGSILTALAAWFFMIGRSGGIRHNHEIDSKLGT